MDALIPQSPTFRLQFPPEIENRFREDYHEKTISTSRLAILMGLLLIAAFGFLDKTTAPQSYPFIWIIRYRIVVPILGLILLLTFSPRLKTWMQFILASGVLLSTLGITAMGAVTHPSEAAFSTYYVGVLLTLMGGYTFTRLRFWYATSIGIVTLIVYEFIALGYQNIMTVPMGREIFYNNNFFLVSANLIGIFTGYFMERYARIDYLQRRQIEQEKVKSENMLQAEAAKALRESEARFRSLVEISTEGVIIINQAGFYQYVSPAMERILGYRVDELIGRSAFEFLHPDDLELAQCELAALLQSPEHVVTTELRALRKDGEMRILESSAKQLPNGDIVAYSNDITDRRQAEEKLRTSEAYYRSIIENSVDGLTLVDPATGKFNYISPSFEKLLGYSLDELNALAPSALMHPDEIEQAQADALKMIANPGQAIISNGRLRHKNDEWIDVETSCKFLPSGEILGNFRDITERKQAAEKLRANEALYRTLIETSTDGITITNPDGTFAYVSPTFEQITGYTANNLIGQPFADFLAPDELESAGRLFTEVLTTPNKTHLVEARYLRSDGAVRLMEASAKVLPDGRIVGYNRDVTERKEAEINLRKSEANFRSLIETSVVGIVILGTDGTFRYVNPAYEAILGYSANELLGQPFASYIHPDDLAEAMQRFGEMLQMPETVIQSEIRAQHKNGSWRSLEGAAKVLPNGDIVAYNRDVTERRRLERALQAIVEGTSSDTGEGFFRSLVQHLAIALQVRYALVAEVTDGQVRALAFWNGDGFGESLEYPLAGTPCENVINDKQLCHYPENVRSLFPTDMILIELGAESYMGFPLVSTSGDVLGHLVVMNDEAMNDVSQHTAILKTFAARAGAELERQQAEVRLRTSEEHYRSLIENSSDGIAIFDRQGVIRYTSPGLTRIVGWEGPELIGQTWHALAHPDDLTYTRGVFHQLFENPGQVIVHESRFLHKDGSWRVMEVVAKLHPNGRVVTNSRDITERKQAEEKLRQLNEELEQRVEERTAEVKRLAAIIETTSDLVGIGNLDGQSIYINHAGRKLLGLNETDDITQMPYINFYPKHVQPLVLDGVEAVLRGETWSHELSMRHQDGHEIPVSQVSFVLYDSNGQPEYLTAIVRDTSAQKRVEAELKAAKESAESALAESKRLAAIIEAMPDYVGIADLQGNSLYVNRAGRRLVGKLEINDSPWNVAQCYPTDSAEQLQPMFQAMQRGEAWVGELYLQHLDGHRIPTDHAIFPLHDANGQIESYAAIIRDITERKQAEAALRESEERFRTIAQASPIPIIISRIGDGTILFANPSLGNLLRIPLAEVIGQKTPNFYYDPTDRARILNEVKNKGFVRDFEFRGKRADQTDFWAAITIQPLMYDGEEVMLAGVYEITELKQIQLELQQAKEAAETALAESKRLTDIIEATSDIVGTADANGNVLYFNQGGLRFIGHEGGVQGLTLSDIYPPQVLADVQNIIAESIATGHKTTTFEAFVYNANREEVPVSVVGITHLAPDGGILLSAIIRDISEHKRNEAELKQAKEAAEAALAESKRLSTIIEATSDMVGTVDLQGTLTYLNPAGYQLAGLDEDIDIHQFRLTDFYPPEALPIIQERIGSNMAQGVDADLFETVIRRRDDREIPVSIVGIIHRTPEGMPASLSAVVRDISSQKRAEAELKQAKETAETANKAKSTFLANMSHEIRTPMNAVIGMTSLLLETSLNAKQRDFVETIRSSGDVLLAIINDILDFSKIEAGKLELVNRPLDLRNSIETTLDLLAPRIAEKNLNIAYYAEHNVPNAIQGDSTRLRQILVNLIGNAVKFTEKGEIVIHVDALLLKEGQNGAPSNYELHFQVHDTGIGIPVDKQGRLFQSFSQVDASSTRVYGGTGLGLAISKRLAEMMGGVMWVESTGIPGDGSTFHFTMEAEEASLPAPKVSRGYVAELTGKKILLVDDHQTNLQILQLQTEAWGMMPRTANSSEEALALLDQGLVFDIAILDAQMPGLNGFELAKKIREREAGSSLGTKRTPLILLASVLDSEADSANLFDALLTKPVKPSSLFDVLMTAFDANESSRTQYPKPERDELYGSTTELLANQYPLRILLAEDVVVNQKFALLALERMGYRADVVANGQEAMEAILRQPYDVALMDINMPVMDGYEASRRIHELWKNGGRPFDIARPWIIAMTANALQGDRELALEAGADDYISKPVYLNELQMVLARAGHERKNQSGGVMSALQDDEAKLNQVYLQGLLNLPDGKSLIEAYLEESPNMIEQIRAAVQHQNSRELKDAAHALKGSSLYVGAEEVAELAKTLEHAGRSNNPDGVESVLNNLEKEYSKVAAVLTNILNS